MNQIPILLEKALPPRAQKCRKGADQIGINISEERAFQTA